MQSETISSTKLLRLGEIVYLFLIALSFYLLIISRTGEAHTVWEVLHPAFMPVLFVAASILAAILLTSEEDVHVKLLLVIVYSILIHSFFSVIFPGGDLSGQQGMLGRSRIVDENAVLYGAFNPGETGSTIYDWFRGENFQAALTVALTRMLSIDLMWVHLFLVPVLWGVFTPIAAYLVTFTVIKNDKASILASLIISAFPYATYFGAISVPNSIGFIFFFFSLYFILKYLSSSEPRITILTLVFCFFSFLTHYLTGMMSLSLLILATAFKSFASQDGKSLASKFSIVTAFILSVMLLPLSLIYLRYFRPAVQTAFTLNKIFELPLQESVGLLLLGELTYVSNPVTILLVIIGPIIGVAGVVYLLRHLRRNPPDESRASVLLLCAAFLIMLIDYRILKLFMEELPLNEERLWVFRDLIAIPFAASAIVVAIASIKSSLVRRFTSPLKGAGSRNLPRASFRRVSGLLLTVNVLFSVVLGGWLTLSLTVAYPQVAPLQTTSYELEAVEFIDRTTSEKYVVIGDVWTIYAGDRIVGNRNPRAYYFGEYKKIGYDLFANMTRDPSTQWMIQAMEYTNTTVAYFIVTQPRLGAETFNQVVSNTIENGLPVYGPQQGFGEGKLYVFYYRR
jgi:hypothetical protein